MYTATVIGILYTISKLPWVKWEILGKKLVPKKEITVNIKDYKFQLSENPIIIRKEDIAKVMRERKGKPLLLIDLAVPRDIEPKVAELESVYIYDIDSLEKVVEKNVYLRQKEIDICDQIIRKQVNEYMHEEIVSLC